MKYRHSFHAGNFADVHKHVTLLALLRALQKKDKGYLYLDTHAGRGAYDLSSPSEEARGGILRLLESPPAAAELEDYLALLGALRAQCGRRYLYPGSPLIAAALLRAQDRAVLIEREGSEVHALAEAIGMLGAEAGARVRIERGDGFSELKARLPPRERRALTLIDPSYEEPRADLPRVAAALLEACRRFATGVVAAWYPIKEQRTSDAWVSECAGALLAPVLVSELWLYPRDARAALNGSGLLIVNPPWLTLERMQVWLPQLQACLTANARAGHSVRLFGARP